MSIAPRDVHAPLTGAIWTLLRWDYPDTGRLDVAFRLALDVDACADLLAGRTVDPVRLDGRVLAKAREASLVQLIAPASLLAGAATPVESVTVKPSVEAAFRRVLHLGQAGQRRTP